MKSKPQHVWIFDSNYRVYPPTPKGKLWGGGPIYREHWVRHEITGETSRSYITRYGAKVPKKGGRGFAFTIDEVNDDVWHKANRYKLADYLSNIRDVALLKRVAETVGYKEAV